MAVLYNFNIVINKDEILYITIFYCATAKKYFFYYITLNVKCKY